GPDVIPCPHRHAAVDRYGTHRRVRKDEANAGVVRKPKLGNDGLEVVAVRPEAVQPDDTGRRLPPFDLHTLRNLHPGSSFDVPKAGNARLEGRLLIPARYVSSVGVDHTMCIMQFLCAYLFKIDRCPLLLTCNRKDASRYARCSPGHRPRRSRISWMRLRPWFFTPPSPASAGISCSWAPLK